MEKAGRLVDRVAAAHPGWGIEERNPAGLEESAEELSMDYSAHREVEAGR